MIKLKLEQDDLGLVKFIDDLNRPRAANRDRVGDAVRSGFAANFSNESAGDGGRWQGLEDSTKRDRRRKGFAPSPILVRTGRYRDSFVNPGSSDHVSEFGHTQNGWFLDEGSQDYRVGTHEAGRQSHVPARPVLPLSRGAEERVYSVLDEFIGFMEDRWEK